MYAVDYTASRDYTAVTWLHGITWLLYSHVDSSIINLWSSASMSLIPGTPGEARMSWRHLSLRPDSVGQGRGRRGRGRRGRVVGWGVCSGCECLMMMMNLNKRKDVKCMANIVYCWIKDLCGDSRRSTDNLKRWAVNTMDGLSETILLKHVYWGVCYICVRTW